MAEDIALETLRQVLGFFTQVVFNSNAYWCKQSLFEW